jgi:hypothetical protein
MLARPRDLPARLVFHGSQPPHLVRKLNLSSPLVSLGLVIVDGNVTIPRL